MTLQLLLTPRDPLVARDGRPFGAGQGTRMRSLDWLYPSVAAGSLRTLLGKESGFGFQEKATVDALKQTAVAGPFPVVDGNLYLPRPSDLVVREESGQRTAFGLRPFGLAGGAGCDLPAGLSPAMLPSTKDFKPAECPAFWSLGNLADWLSHPGGTGFTVPAPATSHDGSWGKGFLPGPQREERTHVKIDAALGAAEESQLFTTAALDFSGGKSGGVLPMSLRVEPAPLFATTVQSLNALHPCGGERRLVHWATHNVIDWRMPAVLIETINRSAQSSPQRLRLTLVSPGLFRDQDQRRLGWKPGWLRYTGTHFEGSPPGCGIGLKLVGAVVERWRPISGWSLESPVGPKPVRRLVPAGATYFFEVTGETISGQGIAEKLWLRPISDDPQDCRDGFGLGAWGVWSP